MWVKILCVVALFVFPAENARILGIAPMPLASHQSAFAPIWKELSLQGHELTVVTPDPAKNPSLVNLTEIDVHSAYNVMAGFKKRLGHHEKLHTSLIEYQDALFNVTKEVLEHPEVQKLLHGSSSFDVVFVESFFPEFLAFGELFNCPTILITSLDPTSTVHMSLGNPSHPVVNPEFVLPFYGKLNFKERFVSTLFQLFINLFRRLKGNPTRDLIIEQYFGKSIRPVEEMMKNIDLQFINANPVFHEVRAHSPTTVEISGGFNLKPPTSLPQDLKEFLDDAKEGFIYFSLGCSVQALNKQNNKVLAELFHELPYKILWKHTEEIPDNVPDNVKIVNWAPQQDVLRHPNIKLFISQGGLQSIEESLFSQVPMVIIPVIGDQFANGKKLQEKGVAKVVSQQLGINKQELLDAISEVIKNPIYKETTKKLVDLIVDQPMTGKDKVVWWTDYVIRHKGTKHLRNRMIDLPWYQYLLLDVFGVMVAVLIVMAVITKLAYKLFMKTLKYLMYQCTGKLKTE